MSFAIGIDLGTSTSEICVYRQGELFVVPDPRHPKKSPIMPSLVAVNPTGQMLVGQPARALVDQPGMGVRESKRLMGTGATVTLGTKTYRPEEIAALILMQLKANAEEALGGVVSEVVLSVPANFPDAARAATMTAGEMARLKVTRLINEPTAAALAFGVKHADVSEQVVVFDFGGGTLDITVLEMTEGVLDVKSSFGDTQLGGKDFDELMIQLILQKFQQQHPHAQVAPRSQRQLKAEAEAAKIALSQQRSVMVQMPAFATQNQARVDLEMMITREEYDRAAGPLLERARRCVQQALAAKTITPQAIDRVLLVGGTTYMPCVRQLVAELFRKEPKAHVDPDLAVVMGAAVQAGLAQHSDRNDPGIILLDVAPYGLGIPLLDDDTKRMYYEALMAPNTTIPYSVQREYRLIHAEQQQVKIRLFQDHTGKARTPEDAHDTGIAASITEIPPSPDGVPHALAVDFSYDLNGLAQLQARIPATGQSVTLRYDKSATRTSEAEVNAGKERVAELWQTNPQTARFVALVVKAKKAMTDPMATAKLTPLVQALEAVLPTSNLVAIEQVAAALTNALFELEQA